MHITQSGVELHDGHWYTTSTPIRGAHCTPDGRPMGIFCAPDRPMVGSPSANGELVMQRGPKRPARIVIQAPDGHDLVEWDMTDPHQPRHQLAVFPIEALADLQPLVEADHLPESRRAHLERGTKLVDPARLCVPLVELAGHERFLARTTTVATK